jgi:hypothetical protein
MSQPLDTFGLSLLLFNLSSSPLPRISESYPIPTRLEIHSFL